MSSSSNSLPQRRLRARPESLLSNNKQNMNSTVQRTSSTDTNSEATSTTTVTNSTSATPNLLPSKLLGGVNTDSDTLTRQNTKTNSSKALSSGKKPTVTTRELKRPTTINTTTNTATTDARESLPAHQPQPVAIQTQKIATQDNVQQQPLSVVPISSAPTPTSQHQRNQPVPRNPAANSSETLPRNATHPIPKPLSSFTIHVSNADLHNATDNGLPKISNRMFGRMRRKVHVESAAFSRSDSLFYAPLPSGSADSSYAPQPLTFASVRPGTEGNHLVSSRHDFEVTLVGMHVTPSQSSHSNTMNQLLMYSVPRRVTPVLSRGGGGVSGGGTEDPVKDIDGLLRSIGIARDTVATGERLSDESYATAGNEPRHYALQHAKHKGRSSSIFSSKILTRSAHLNAEDEPMIHYDPVDDGHASSVRAPNTFRAVPARKSLLYFHRGADHFARATVPVRFSVMEVDCSAAAQQTALYSVGGVPAGRTRSFPLGKVSISGVNGIKSLGESSFSQFARKGNIISKDFEFRLMRELCEGEAASESSEPEHQTVYDKSGKYADNYLRYGYYFFLGKKIDARLYAQTDTSSQAVPLLLRRMGRRAERGALGERQFFPLTGVSYVVMRVSPGCAPERAERTDVEKEADRERLDDLLNMNQALSFFSGRI